MHSFSLEDHPATVQKTNFIIYISCKILIKAFEKISYNLCKIQEFFDRTSLHNDQIYTGNLFFCTLQLFSLSTPKPLLSCLPPTSF